jgi:hypothetical protein
MKGRSTTRLDFRLILEEVEVVKDQKHGQNDVDNHTSQNYNVEQF